MKPQNPHHLRCTGFTLIELIACLAVVGVIISLLVPALASSRQSAWSAQCLSQLRQIGVAFELYKTNSREHYPFADDSVNVPDGRVEPVRLLSSILGVEPPQTTAPDTTNESPPWRCPADPVIARRYGTSYRYELWTSFLILGRQAVGIVSNNANAGRYPAIMQELVNYHSPSTNPMIVKMLKARHFLKHDGSVDIHP